MTLSRLRHIAIMATVAVMAATISGCKGCGAPSESKLPTKAEVVNAIRRTDRLYVAEYVVHKIITANDVKRITGRVLGVNINIRTSIGDRKIAIPMEAIVKAYVDFESLTVDDVVISDSPRKLTVTLKRPVAELTSTKIKHEEIREYTDFLRKSFSDEDMSNFEKQGREVILASIPNMGIVDRAKKNAKDLMSQMFKSLGFEKVDVVFKD